MYLQVTLVTECFITHITAIWTLPSTYTFLQLQTIAVPQCFITHHNDMDATQYVDVDAISGAAIAGMFYYTNYRHMGAHQYVHVDVHSVLTC